MIPSRWSFGEADLLVSIRYRQSSYTKMRKCIWGGVREEAERERGGTKRALRRVETFSFFPRRGSNGPLACSQTHHHTFESFCSSSLSFLIGRPPSSSSPGVQVFPFRLLHLIIGAGACGRSPCLSIGPNRAAKKEEDEAHALDLPLFFVFTGLQSEWRNSGLRLHSPLLPTVLSAAKTLLTTSSATSTSSPAFGPSDPRSGRPGGLFSPLF